eukprot:gene43187-57466_t
MDAARREIRDGAVVIQGPAIAWVGATAELPAAYLDALRNGNAEAIDMHGHVVMPGLVNTHHHMYQSLTRAVPEAQDAELFGWLTNLYLLWARLTPEMIRVSTQTAMAELMLSGCTTTSDHLYLFPNGSRLDDSIEAADAMGMRFHAARGSMSVGRSAGGLPPDEVVETEEAILRDSERLIGRWHDASGLLHWELHHGDFLAFLETSPVPEIIFYDPFSSKTDSPLWTPAVFTRLFAHCAPKSAELYTYSAATAVRVRLITRGIRPGKRPVANHKRLPKQNFLRRRPEQFDRARQAPRDALAIERHLRRHRRRPSGAPDPSQRGDRSRILERRTDDLDGIDDAHLDHVAIGRGLRVVTEGQRRVLEDLADNHRAFVARIVGDLAQRLLQG